MATAVEYALIAALAATVIIIGAHAWPSISQPDLRPAITEPARP